MNKKTILEAQSEAERFIFACDEVLERLKKDGGSGYCIPGSAESGACRRASMDLSRALAKLRR